MITPFPNSKNTKAFTGCHPVKAFYVRILWAGGFRRLRRPGSIVRVLRTERWVRPTERAGSEGSFICRCLGQRKPYNRPGALWGLRVLKFDGAIAPRVLKFDAPPARGVWWRL